MRTPDVHLFVLFFRVVRIQVTAIKVSPWLKFSKFRMTAGMQYMTFGIKGCLQSARKLKKFIHPMAKSHIKIYACISSSLSFVV